MIKTQKRIYAGTGKKRENKKLEILEKALDLVGREGLSGLSLHTLAKEMDFTVGALYRYFDSKEALLVELQSGVLQDFHQVMKKTLVESEGFFKKDLLASFSIFQILLLSSLYQEFSRHSPASFRLLSLMLGDPHKLVEDQMGMVPFSLASALFKDVCDLFEKGEKHKAMKKGKSLERTLIFWACQHGVMQLQKLSRFSPSLFSPEKLVQEALETLFLGWGVGEKYLKEGKKILQKFQKKFPLSVFFEKSEDVKIEIENQKRR